MIRDPPASPLFPYTTLFGSPRDAVLADVVTTLTAAARRAVGLGVDPASVLLDPTHDFGKNTWHSLHLLRRTEVLVGLGHPDRKSTRLNSSHANISHAVFCLK